MGYKIRTWAPLAGAIGAWTMAGIVLAVVARPPAGGHEVGWVAGAILYFVFFLLLAWVLIEDAYR